MHDEEYDMQDLLPGKKNNNRGSILSKIQNIESDDYTTSSGFSSESFLPSSLLKENKSSKKEKSEASSETGFRYDPDDWFDEMLGYQNAKSKKSKGSNSLFDSAGITGKKKKKKNKKKGDMIDYRKELEPESALYKNLLMEQTRFTESLQKEYDTIKSTKSSNRGMTKQMTDLVKNITEARALAMQLVDKQVNIKKQAAELNMKQHKEMGGDLGDSENIADFASTYLKQMLNERQSLFNGGSGEQTVSDYTEDELFDELSLSLDSDESTRPEEVDKYLEYENRNVTIYVVITNDDVENYEFVAKDEEDNVIDDYPMPNHTSISVNRSTNIATDVFGKKYQIIWQ